MTSTSLLLAPDDVLLYARSASDDDHGWHVPGTALARWTGRGSLQLTEGAHYPRADGGGGRGPFDPANRSVGTVYLPEDAMPEEGMVLVARGREFVLSQVRYLPDPSAGNIGCWMAALGSVDTWPA